ncbi:MAG: SBBP repeat-containing protein [Chloroflexota bacterium]
MNTRLLLALILLVIVIGVAGRTAAQSAVSTAASRRLSMYNDQLPMVNDQPLLFVENVGQWDARARFQARSGNVTLWLAEDALWLTMIGPQSREPGEAGPCPPAPFHLCPPAHGRGVNIRLSFVEANPQLELVGFDGQNTQVSYLVGEPERWRANVPVWTGVRYRDLYPGLDLELVGVNGRFTPRLVCRTNCQSVLQQVQLRVEGAEGVALTPYPSHHSSLITHHLSSPSQGEGKWSDSLYLSTAVGDVFLPLLPVIAAEGATLPHSLPTPTIQGQTILTPFRSGPAPQMPVPDGQSHGAAVAPEIQNPKSKIQNADDASDLLYSTFLGGTSTETAFNLAVDSNGAAYVAGDTYSTDFPITPGVFDPWPNGSADVYVAKLDETGRNLIFATYLGGGGIDLGDDLAVDPSGNVYLAGKTLSSNFPVTAGAYDTSYNGGWDIYVAKLNANGTAIFYATYLGGPSEDYGEGVVIDAAGSAYVVSEVWSANYPTTAGAYDTTYNGLGDIAVTKLDAAGGALVYSTFIGAGDYDCWDCDIAIDPGGATYLIGYTKSGNYPTTGGAFDTTYNGGWDGYLTKLNAAGSALVYSTFLGGSADDCYEDCDVTVDSNGNAYVSGNTYSSNFPTTAGAFDTTLGGVRDGFLTKLNTNGSALVYSTYLGGSDSDQAHHVVVDANGRAAVVGKTWSLDFPTTPDGYDLSHNGLTDVFLTRFNPTGDSLAYSTYVGGSSSDCGYKCGLGQDRQGNLYLSGDTHSANFPVTPDAYDTTLDGYNDAFVLSLGAGVFCGEGFAIPDNDPAGASSAIAITNTHHVLDMDVIISTTHTYVGQLVYTLTHESTGRSVTLIDRPGVPATPYGCAGDDIEAILDDEATDLVEDACTPAIPTIQGEFRPNNPLDAFDLELLDGDWTLTVSDNFREETGEVVEWCLVPTLGESPLVLEKTVGMDPNACATTEAIATYAGTEVTYCFQATNSGETLLRAHDLVDSHLGTIFTGRLYDLEPGASVFVTRTTTVSESVVNTADWTAYTGKGTPTMGSDTASVTIIPEGCSMPNAAIPDDDPAGITDTLVIPTVGPIEDLNVSLLAEHTWVGDLVVRLQHVETGTTITLMDRPGYPPVPSCNGNDVDATFDDEAFDRVEDECASSIPAIQGTFIPNNLLANFDGQELSGAWQLTVADVVPHDVGALTMWCMLPTVNEADIAVEPAALSSEQAPDRVVTETLTIRNDGGADLAWTIEEAAYEESCATAADLPWAAVTPITGTVAGGESASAAVIFDSSGLTLGVYTGTLCVNSNDPDEALLTVPLTLTVRAIAYSLKGL